ncbi:MAG: SBBP repeat-containing protein, partial [Deltaproteobacteria bacterium]|nr:SBBP repeat-containing protein [Deltaproteobacteria bacterium]
MICANVNASAGASMVLDGRLVIKIVKILAVGFFSILAMAGAAQAQGLIWAKRAGGTMIGDAGIGTSVDGLGNSYITGNFQGTASFGSTMLASAGSDDIFVAKYDSNGNLLWAKKDGGMGSDRGAGIAVDGLGNSYVTGVFNGTAIFGPGEANEVSLASNGSEDIFVAKYASDGTFIWATKAGGPGADQGARVAVDGSGNSFVTGFFNGTATFGAGEPNETMLTSSNGSDDIFVAKFDSTGALLWAKKAGGSGLDRGSGIALDGSGSSYATGFFSGIATFESTSLTSAGDWDVFLAKYDSSGTLVWAKRAGGSNRDRSFSVAVDGLGNSYVSGLFNGSATFGFGEANQTMLTSVGLDDVFLANFDATGVLRWAKRAGGTGSDGGQSIAVDDLGNSYVTGFFNGITHPGPATFGLGELNQTTLISAGDRDIFFAKYNVNGRLVWVTRAGGASTDQGMAIAVDQLGNSFATGFFAANFGGGSATFGFAEENETTLISAGNEDIFIAKFRNSDAVQFNNLAATAGENVLAGGIESNGVGRGPAFQLFDPSGLLQFTQFVLNPDFTDTNFIPGNFDVDTAGEVLVGGRESLGSSRGPAYQLFDTNGAFMFTRFVLNPDFTGLSFSPFSVSSTNGALVCGRETLGVARGPAYQAFDSGGNLVRTQFALNTDFITDNSCIGANLDGVLGDEAILGGREVTGAARGPAIQAF